MVVYHSANHLAGIPDVLRLLPFGLFLAAASSEGDDEQAGDDDQDEGSQSHNEARRVLRGL